MNENFQEIKKSSPRRIAASRANGAKSRGPVTLEGKESSRRNALKHGFASAAVVLTSEDWDSYLETRECYIRRFQPADEIELDLVEQMVAARWRQQRIWSIESSALDDELDAQRVEVDKNYEEVTPDVRTWLAFKKLAGESTALALMNRYESRYSRQYHRALKALMELQANRPPASAPSDLTTDNRQLPTEELPKEPNPTSEHPPERPVRAAIHRQSPGVDPTLGLSRAQLSYSPALAATDNWPIATDH
jgi:hypothetical protein